MTTIAESTTTLGAMMDGIADGLLNNHSSEWSEPDADVKNDQSTEQWHDNGRLLKHSTSGLFLLMYITYRENFRDRNNNQDVGGIRVVVSTGWNSTDNHPVEKTNVINSDPFENEVANHRGSSVIEQRDDEYHYAMGIWPIGSETDHWPEASVSSRSDAATLVECTWWGSVGTDHISVASYDTQDTNDGNASWFSWEHTDAKFWADGVVPFFMYECDNQHGDDYQGMYGFQWYDQQAGNSHCDFSRSDGADWGYINPDPEDDTYFFKRPIIYTESNDPASYVTNFIYNKNDEGSSGDTITHNGTDYRLFQDTGASEGSPVAVGLRFT